MFDGDWSGVGLTVAPLDPVPCAAPPPEGVPVRPTRLTELLPVATRTPAGKAAELRRVQRLMAQPGAYQAALIVGFAIDRPDTDDCAVGDPGAAAPGRAPVDRPAGVSEFLVDELAAALDTSVTSASHTWSLHATLHDRLPGTWTAMADGELDLPRGRAIAAEVARSPDTDPLVVLAVEAAVLPRAMELTVTRLRAAVRAELVAHAALFAERRRREAERTADAVARPSLDAPGSGGARRRAPERGGVRLLGRRRPAGPCGRGRRGSAADRGAAPRGRARPGPRPRHRPRPAAAVRARHRAGAADALEARQTGEPVAPLVLHDAEVTAFDEAAADTDAGAQSPVPAADPTGRRTATGEVNGQPITHQHLRALLDRLDALCPGGLRAPTGGTLQIALTDPDGTLRALLARPDLERTVRRGCPDHPRGADCGCGLADRPPPVDRYRPTPAQYRFVRTRDRRCRMPGCTIRAAWADLDHVVAHREGGATDCHNLCCLCRRHHRLKTHARGWSFVLTPDGALVVTTPSGITRIDRPPGMRTARPADGPPPRRRARFPAPHADDPPPF